MGAEKNVVGNKEISPSKAFHPLAPQTYLRLLVIRLLRRKRNIVLIECCMTH